MKKYVIYLPNEIINFCEDPGDSIVYSVLDLNKPKQEIVDQFCSDLTYDHYKAYALLAKHGIISKEFACLKLASIVGELNKDLNELMGE